MQLNVAHNMVMSSAYAGSVRYYATMIQAYNVAINTVESHLDRAWAYNHCHIAGANGQQILTIPIVKPSNGSTTIIKDIKISTHGDWERIHWGALFSAYGKAPFFEYIEAELQSIYMNHGVWLIDFNYSLHNLIIDFLDLPIITDKTESCAETENMCQLVGEKKRDSLPMQDVEYYQLWKSRHGFIPDLSILDLLMNTGRESIFILNEMSNSLSK